MKKAAIPLVIGAVVAGVIVLVLQLTGDKGVEPKADGDRKVQRIRIAAGVAGAVEEPPETVVLRPEMPMARAGASLVAPELNAAPTADGTEAKKPGVFVKLKVKTSWKVPPAKADAVAQISVVLADDADTEKADAEIIEVGGETEVTIDPLEAGNCAGGECSYDFTTTFTRLGHMDGDIEVEWITSAGIH